MNKSKHFYIKILPCMFGAFSSLGSDQIFA